jgi:hypothetical protein
VQRSLDFCIAPLLCKKIFDSEVAGVECDRMK